MRTKTLLLTAACAAIGTVAASAQSVYSVNAVGYVNLTVPAGLSIIGNPLNTTNNAISNILATVPDSTTLYVWNGAGFNIANYLDGIGWDNPNLQLAPGLGAWIKNTSGSATTITFVGEVMQGSLTNSLKAGVNLRSSMVPQTGALDTVLQYTPADGDVVYQYVNATGKWKIFNYLVGIGWDVGSAPTPAIGEGIWIKTSAATNWVRTFSVN